MSNPPATVPGGAQPGPKPGNDQPNRPGREPGAGRPGLTIPGTENPGKLPAEAERPGANRPGANQPGANRPGRDRPGLNRPGNKDDDDGVGAQRPGRPRPNDNTPNQPGPGQPGNKDNKLPIAEQPNRPQRPGLGNGGNAAGGNPVARPNQPGAGKTRPERPVANKPGVGTKDDLVGILPDLANTKPAGRPAIGATRPNRRPGNDIAILPDVVDPKPGRPGLNRPGDGNRPNRPPQGQRPGGNNNNNTNIVNNNIVNNNVVNNNVVNNSNHNHDHYNNWWRGNNNRYNRWDNYWYSNHIHYHNRGWYRGCWGGVWATTWVAPYAYSSITFGGSNFLFTSGVVQYYNPYYTPTIIVHNVDYTRPIVVQRVVQVVDNGGGAAPPVAQDEPGLADFDSARIHFRGGNYQQARTLIERSLQVRPGDPAAHEFYALCLFALGEYQPTAAVLNALLATSPGWDWTTMSNLYGNANAYERQLRALENVARSDPGNDSYQFVLGYHYLVCGHFERAYKCFARVRDRQPRDRVAAKLASALEPTKITPPAGQPAPAIPAPVNPPPVEQPILAERPENPGQPQLTVPDENVKGIELAEKPPEPHLPLDPDENDDGDSPDFDLVGVWVASLPQGGKVTLTITEESRFTWLVDPQNGDATVIAGELSTTDEMLVLDSDGEGAMIGEATIADADEFQFALKGAPPDEPALRFKKK